MKIRSHGSEMRCRTCGYNLRGLPERRCPECGRMFDPADARTYLAEPINGARLLALALLGVVLFAWPPLFGRHLVDHLPLLLIPLGPLSMISGLVIGGTIGWRCIQIIWHREPWVMHRWAIVPALVVGGGAFVLYVVGTFVRVIYELAF